jgi:hypothetical protein
MEFEKKKVSSIDSFREFIGKIKCNPLTKTPVLLAKDTSFPYQRSEDAYVLLLPLVVKDMYMYVQPYVDQKTDLTEYCIKVGKIEELVVSGNNQVHSFNGSKSSDVRLNKGIRYVSFLAEFFDPEKNKYLYKTIKNNRMLAERKVKYDTDKKEYQDKSGYVEVQHLRVQNEGSVTNYVQIMCVKASKGERAPAKICAFLDGEWKYVSKYLNYIIQFYKMNDIGMSDGVQKRRIESMRRDVMDAVGKVLDEKNKKNDKKVKDDEGEHQDGTGEVEEPGPSGRKRKMTKKDNSSNKPSKINKISPENDSTNDDNKNDVEDIDLVVRKAEDEMVKSMKQIVESNIFIKVDDEKKNDVDEKNSGSETDDDA